MKKLDLNDLRVDSFTPVEAETAEFLPPYTMRSCPQVGCPDSLELC
ncbi:MAG TPA: hypothetical protein VK358_11375 [Longimicrobium sp.]|nr:hypothetical protein [Longimicrobium sp.]